MAGGEPEIEALSKNLSFIKGKVQNNLHWFADCLIAEGFTPRKTARTILGNNKRAPGELTGDLMDEVFTTIENAEDKRAWFDKFVAIFSQSRAYEDLVKRLKRCVYGDNGGGVRDDGGKAPRKEDDDRPSGGAAVIVPSEDGACDTDWFFPVNDEERHDPRMGEGFIEFTRDLWRKKELRVFFMNTPDDCDRDAKEILQIANEWHDCAQDVVPKFVECDKPKRSDIRVEYIDKGTSKSAVGTRASKYCSKIATMLLERAPNKRTIRHEFGHALGLQHEHSHPDARRLYDPEKLRKYLKRCYPDKSWAYIESRIERQWARKEVAEESSNYDNRSVMHYLIPKEVRAKDYVGPKKLQIELSAGDKAFIKKIYSEVFRAIDEETEEMDTADDTEGGADGNDEASGGQRGVFAEDSGPSKGGGAKKEKPKPAEKGAAEKEFTPEDFARFKEKPHLNDLMEYVGFDLQAKWEAIALGLGIEKPRIAAIRMNHQGKPDAPQHCMTDVFDEWRRTKPREYSWKKLAAVLYTRAVGEKGHLTYLHTELSKKL